MVEDEKLLNDIDEKLDKNSLDNISFKEDINEEKLKEKEENLKKKI